MSPPPDPDRIARAMVSPLWSGLIRTGADIKTIGSWDTALIRQPRLLVPIDVQALYVASLEAMEQLIAMGMEQGITEAVGQIDAILAETGR